MPSIISSDGQNLVKNCYASAPNLDLTVICNGEEQTSIFDSFGNLLPAGISAPTSAPIISDGGSSGTGVAGYVAYCYVYAATRRYPRVENITAAGGSVAPRSNPSPASTPFLVTASHKKNIVVVKSTRSDIDKIWIYRTQTFSTPQLASIAAEAGELFYIGSLNNDGNSGTITFSDNVDVPAGEQIENDNFLAPTAAFCVFYEPYFYLFGNFPLQVQVTISYNTVGPRTTITLTDSNITQWFQGRDRQFIKFAGVSTGGYDSFGTFIFKYLGPTTAQLVTDDLDTNGYIGFIGSTTATIFGFSTTLYRSKANNPFGWGKTSIVGNLAIPELYTLKVGGGIGTGLCVLPNNAILKLDTENPAKCYSLNLKLQNDDDFESTLRVLSDSYSTSANATQFATLNQNKQGIIWALDLKNYSIIASDGGQQVPISDNVIKFLRSIDTSDDAQKNYHGIFDPYTECNFIWVKQVTNHSPVITHCIYQHIPTGQWGICKDFDITASSSLQDIVTNKDIVLFGSDTGMFGKELNTDISFGNWIASSFLGQSSYEIIGIDTTKHTVEITRLDSMQEAEDLTYIKFYFVDGSSVQRSVFIYFNLHASSDPAESAGFDYIKSIATTLGAGGLSVVSAIATALSTIPTLSTKVISTSIFIYGNKGVSIDTTTTSYNTNVINIPVDVSVTISSNLNYSSLTIVQENRVKHFWALVELTNNTHIWMRIIAVYANTSTKENILYFDSYYDTLGISGSLVVGLSIYIGLIECKFQHSFDLSQLTQRKTLKEFWIASQFALNKRTGSSNHSYYNEKLLLGFNNQVNVDPQILTIPNQDQDAAGVLQDMFFITPKNIPSNPFKTFGITVVQRGFGNHKVFNLALKMTT